MRVRSGRERRPVLFACPYCPCRPGAARFQPLALPLFHTVTCDAMQPSYTFCSRWQGETHRRERCPETMPGRITFGRRQLTDGFGLLRPERGIHPTKLRQGIGDLSTCLGNRPPPLIKATKPEMAMRDEWTHAELARQPHRGAEMALRELAVGAALPSGDFAKKMLKPGPVALLADGTREPEPLIRRCGCGCQIAGSEIRATEPRLAQRLSGHDAMRLCLLDRGAGERNGTVRLSAER